MKLKNANRIALILIVAAACVAVGLAWAATHYGPGVGGDATIYLTSARNFAAGKGLGWVEADGTFRLLPYSPPLYPLILSLAGLFTSNLVGAARWLNLLFFAGLVMVVGGGFYRFTRQPWLAGLLAGVVATSPVIVGVQVWAMTEPIFLLTGFAGLFLLLEYFETRQMHIFYASALLVGMAFLARYAGAAFVGTAALALFIFLAAQKRFWASWRSVLLYGVVAILPTLLWLIVDFALTGTVGSRSGQPVGSYWERFVSFFPALQQIYLFWLLPESMIGRVPGGIRALLWLLPLIGLGAALWWVLRKTPGQGKKEVQPALRRTLRVSWMMALLMGVYLLVLVIVQVFTYPPVTLASRMLSPVHLGALILAFALLAWGMENVIWRRQAVVAAIYGVALVLLAMYGVRGGLIARDDYRTGLGYTAPEWQHLPILEAARNLPPSVPLISNDTTALMFLLDRPAYPLQEIYAQQPILPYTSYGQGDDPSQRAFREQSGALVLFQASLQDDFAIYGDRAQGRVAALVQGLYPFYQGKDGAIYFFNPSFARRNP